MNHNYTPLKRHNLESAIAEICKDYPPDARLEVIAHTLQHDGQGWSTNDSWYLSRNALPQDIPAIARGRWEAFKANYAPRARVNSIECDGETEYSLYVNAEGMPFLELRRVTE